MRYLLLSALGLGLCLSTPAGAAEIFAGLHAHGVKTPLSLEADRESGVDVSLGVRGGSFARVLGGELQPYAFGSLNLNGDTNFLAAGISARFGGKTYVRPGLGIAIHDGSASNFDESDRLAFGSRFLLAPEIAVGTRINDRLSIEASLVHFSHGQIFGTQNPGIDSLGIRLNWRL